MGELNEDVLFAFCLRTKPIKSPLINPGDGHLTRTETGREHSVLEITGTVDGAMVKTQVLIS